VEEDGRTTLDPLPVIRALGDDLAGGRHGGR